MRRVLSHTFTALMTLNPNSFEAVKPKLSAKTLRDIEGLDPAKFGFEREECCGAIPETLANSMKLTEHVLFGSRMPYTQWAKRLENVPGYDDLQVKVKSLNPHAMFTVCQIGETDGEWLMRIFVDEKFGSLVIMQYFLHDASTYEIPWKVKGTFAYERTNDYFVLVCAHTQRDGRCGYCGPVLIDLLQQALLRRLGEERARQVSVYPCSHVGGHVYAGNVILYSRHGGVCFGLFKPADVEQLVDTIAEDRGVIPIGLQSRIRGRMVIKGNVVDCSLM